MQLVQRYLLGAQVPQSHQGRLRPGLVLKHQRLQAPQLLQRLQRVRCDGMVCMEAQMEMREALHTSVEPFRAGLHGQRVAWMEKRKQGG